MLCASLPVSSGTGVRLRKLPHFDQAAHDNDTFQSYTYCIRHPTRSLVYVFEYSASFFRHLMFGISLRVEFASAGVISFPPSVFYPPFFLPISPECQLPTRSGFPVPWKRTYSISEALHNSRSCRKRRRNPVYNDTLTGSLSTYSERL